MNKHGHNAIWMLPIWGLIGFVGLVSMSILGYWLGMFVATLSAYVIIKYLADNAKDMPVSMRSDIFEYYKKMRTSNLEQYAAMKNEGGFVAKEILDFEVLLEREKAEAYEAPASTSRKLPVS